MTEPRPGGRTVAFVLDNPQRDLAGLALTAARLCEHGVTCYLVPASLRVRELFAVAPDLVVLYHFRRGFESFVRRCLEARIRVAVLDTEGGVWSDAKVYVDLQIPDDELRRAVRVYCAWGPRLADALVAAGVYRPGQVAVTGCPRFDFYAEAWRPPAAAGTPAGARILVNSNYSEANPRVGTVEHALQMLRDTWGWDADHVARICETQQVMLRETLALTRRLATDFPSAAVVLRPHPFEGVDVYRRELAGVRGVAVEDGGPIQHQILRARATIQRTSTTAVETALVGVPALQPAWWPAELAMPVVDAVSEQCGSYGELRDQVGEILAGRYTPSAALAARVHSTLADWFSGVDGLAHRRVADALLAHLPEQREVDARRCRDLMHGLADPHPLRQRVPRLLRRGFGLSPDHSFRHFRAVPPAWWTSSAQGFTAGDVAAALAEIGAAPHTPAAGARRARALPARQSAAYGHRFDACSVAVVAGN